MVVERAVVDVADAGLDALCDLDGVQAVAGDDAGGQTEGRVVGDADGIFLVLGDAGANLSVKQCYALKAVTYNIMALFSDWEITDKKDRGISIDGLIDFFKWASEPMVSCIIENRDEWAAVKGEVPTRLSVLGKQPER